MYVRSCGLVEVRACGHTGGHADMCVGLGAAELAEVWCEYRGRAS